MLVIPAVSFLGHGERVREHWRGAYERALRDYTAEADRRRLRDGVWADLKAEQALTEKHLQESWDYVRQIGDRVRAILKAWLAESTRGTEPYSWLLGSLEQGHVRNPLGEASHFYSSFLVGADLTLGYEIDEMPKWYWWKQVKESPVPAVLADAQLLGLLYCVRMRDEVLTSAARVEARRMSLARLVYHSLLNEPLPWDADLSLDQPSPLPPWVRLLEKERPSQVWRPLMLFLDHALATVGVDQDKYPANVEHFADVCRKSEEAVAYCVGEGIDLDDLPSRLLSGRFAQLKRQALATRAGQSHQIQSRSTRSR